MCIEKKKWDGNCDIRDGSAEDGYTSSEMTLDIYIMNESDMYCYSYEYKALAIEYTPVDLPMRTTFRCQISINCANFKRYLNDCAMQGEYLKFTSSYKEIADPANPGKPHRMIETVLTPVRGILRLARLSLSLFSPVPDDFDVKAFGDPLHATQEHEFCIASLQLFTKATTLCQNVRLLLDKDFPAVIEYDVGTMGKLRFVLAWRVNSDELERTVKEHCPLPITSPPTEEDLETELALIERDVMQIEEETD